MVKKIKKRTKSAKTASNKTSLLFKTAQGLVAQKKFKQAEERYRRILSLAPGNPDALHFLGVTQHLQGRHRLGRDNIQRAIAQAPNNQQYSKSLAKVLLALRVFSDAEAALLTIVRVKPQDSDALYDLAKAQHGQDKLNEAMTTYRRVIALKPEHSKAYCQLGIALKEARRISESIELLGLAAEKFKLNPDIATYLGASLELAGETEKAQECYRKTIELYPQYANAHFFLGMLLLAENQFAEGWQEYEWRLSASRAIPEIPQLPRWTGEPIKDKSLLVLAEQGLGDTLQFARYLQAAQIASEARQVCFLCQPGMQAVLEGLCFEGTIVEASPEAFRAAAAQADYWVPLLSLPSVFGVNVKSELAPVYHYLAPDQALVTKWKQVLGRKEGEVLIGINWQANPKLVSGREKSIDLSAWRPLTELQNIRFISLQRDSLAEGSLDTVQQFPDLDCEQRFVDTAALIANCDLVISVDTSVIHLAGALGKPAWILLPRFSEWRWKMDSQYHPWYQGMSFFQQEQLGSWEEVLLQVRESLVDRFAHNTSHSHRLLT